MSGDDCLSDHAHVAWSQHSTLAGGKEYLLHRLRCDVCRAEVTYTETPNDVETRKKVEADGQRDQ